jgi:hypothetical protein
MTIAVVDAIHTKPPSAVQARMLRQAISGLALRAQNAPS